VLVVLRHIARRPLWRGSPTGAAGCYDPRREGGHRPGPPGRARCSNGGARRSSMSALLSHPKAWAGMQLLHQKSRNRARRSWSRGDWEVDHLARLGCKVLGCYYRLSAAGRFVSPWKRRGPLHPSHPAPAPRGRLPLRQPRAGQAFRITGWSPRPRLTASRRCTRPRHRPAGWRGRRGRACLRLAVKRGLRAMTAALFNRKPQARAVSPARTLVIRPPGRSLTPRLAGLRADHHWRCARQLDQGRHRLLQWG
jgi:hypothetical protein